MELIEYKEMREAIVRVRELHNKADWDVCPVCIQWDELEQDYVGVTNPCQTIKALDGEQ
jgi:hypothetical protein